MSFFVWRCKRIYTANKKQINGIGYYILGILITYAAFMLFSLAVKFIIWVIPIISALIPLIMPLGALIFLALMAGMMMSALGAIR